MFESIWIVGVAIVLWKVFVITYEYKTGKRLNRTKEGIILTLAFDFLGLIILWVMGPNKQNSFKEE